MRNQQGFVAISIVLILASVVLVVVSTVALLSINEAQSSLSMELGESNLDFVEGCTEDVLQKINQNPSFNGTSITRPEGICSITYITGTPNWDITVTAGGTNAFQRKIEVKFTRTSQINLTSWQEI